jgi:hypothetical protein
MGSRDCLIQRTDVDAEARMAQVILFIALLLTGQLLQGSAHAQATARPLEFRPGNAKQAALLAKVPDAREVVAEPFGLAMIDLDGDGKNEIIVRADSNANCGTGGCLTVVLQQRGSLMATLLSQNLYPNLGVTDQKFGAYKALAALDDKGGIATGDKPGSPLHGKLMIYPMLAQAAEVPAVAGTSTSSSAAPPRGKRPDMLGIQVGISGVADVKAVLAAMKPPLMVKEYFTQLVGTATQNRGMGQSMEIEGGRFLGAIEANTAGFQQACQNFSPTGSKSDCEHLRVHFSGPPDAGTVVALFRNARFVNGATADTVIKGLTAKYGPPGHVRDYQGRGFSFDLAWAWAADGSSLPMKEGHPCANRNAAHLRADANRQYEHAGAVLQSRCAVILHVVLGAANGIVGSMEMTLADHATIHATTSKTIDFVTGSVARKDRQERDSAAKAAAPKF